MMSIVAEKMTLSVVGGGGCDQSVFKAILDLKTCPTVEKGYGMLPVDGKINTIQVDKNSMTARSGNKLVVESVVKRRAISLDRRGGGGRGRLYRRSPVV
jgi:hypothetical protein